MNDTSNIIVNMRLLMTEMSAIKHDLEQSEQTTDNSQSEPQDNNIEN